MVKKKKKTRRYRRDRIENWLDRHNHKLELIRTIGNIIAGIGGTIAILRILEIL